MNIKHLIKPALLAMAGIAVVMTLPVQADAQKVKWKMQSAFGGKLAHLGPSGLRFADKVKSMSEGKFIIKFFEPGAGA